MLLNAALHDVCKYVALQEKHMQNAARSYLPATVCTKTRALHFSCLHSTEQRVACSRKEMLLNAALHNACKYGVLLDKHKQDAARNYFAPTLCTKRARAIEFAAN